MWGVVEGRKRPRVERASLVVLHVVGDPKGPRALDVPAVVAQDDGRAVRRKELDFQVRKAGMSQLDLNVQAYLCAPTLLVADPPREDST